ncbi:MAG: transglutaminase family protein, partial [Pseudomonadota bacterium]
ALKRDLAPYLVAPEMTPRLAEFMLGAPAQSGTTNDFMVALNCYVQENVGYIVRMEPGVQTPEETLTRGRGSCRDSGWLLVQMLRHLGYAARFVSGYLIQLTADEKPVEGPAGPAADFTDLHAWTEVYLPGAGWVGLDPTSGLFAGEGHIPLAATPEPRSAAPIAGVMEKAEVEFDVHMEVRRLEESPRVTKPVTDVQWSRILAAGDTIDARGQAHDMRLTMGGEPTFVSALDRDAPEWTIDAVGPTKRAHAEDLIRRLQKRFAPGGLLHFGQGKWYPGEQLPRWAFALYWRGDGAPLWQDPALIAPEAAPAGATYVEAANFTTALAEALGVEAGHADPAYEDTAAFLLREQNLPANVDPSDPKLDDPEERARLVRVFDRGLGRPAAYVLPLQLAQARDEREDGARQFRWSSEKWHTRRGHLFLVPGDSPAGFRLPLEALGYLDEAARPQVYPRDPFAPAAPLPTRPRLLRQAPGRPPRSAPPGVAVPPGGVLSAPAVRTALTIEPRGGVLCVFLPPLPSVDAYADLIGAIEQTAASLSQPVHIEGYPPPPDARLNVIKVTPDPGVIEVNVHPAHTWREQVAITEVLYEEARQCRLDASSFQIDGRPSGSGGGNHIVAGGASPADSPFLRRPDLLASVISYWQRHPSLSYLFSGLFIGPTSQAPRLDEARQEMLDEMEIALAQLPPPGVETPPWLVDRIFRHLLVDVTGNTHRAEICIDKLYSPDGPTGRLGLVEFRGFEMPPHARMAAAQALVIRALLTWFWQTPFRSGVKPHGRALHDRYLLPHFLEEDFRDVLADLSRAHGLGFDPAWFAAQIEFRFPQLGTTTVEGVEIELRSAIEPWNVLGEEGVAAGVARFVDSSVERLQVRLSAPLPPGCALAVNGVEVALTPIEGGAQVAGVRFRAWQPPSCLHPTIPAHGPLVFDIVERESGRSRGGCTYHVAHPGGRAHETRPINALEAEGRRLARFMADAHSPGPVALRSLAQPPGTVTTDLRRAWLA